MTFDFFFVYSEMLLLLYLLNVSTLFQSDYRDTYETPAIAVTGILVNREQSSLCLSNVYLRNKETQQTEMVMLV